MNKQVWIHKNDGLKGQDNAEESDLTLDVSTHASIQQYWVHQRSRLQHSSCVQPAYNRVDEVRAANPCDIVLTTIEMGQLICTKL